MTNPDRYFSIIKRQRPKFEYAETLVSVFAEAAADLGAQRTQTALADWLTARRVKPSAKAKAGAKWHRQNLVEILDRLGDPPTLNSPQVAGYDLDWAYDDWNKMTPAKRDGFGPRYAATVWFVRCRSGFEGLGELAREEEKLLEHCAYIESVISKLRAAFPIAARSF